MKGCDFYGDKCVLFFSLILYPFPFLNFEKIVLKIFLFRQIFFVISIHFYIFLFYA